MQDIGLKKGIFYSFLGKYSNIFVSFIIISILSRLLSPREFGILAVINVFMTFFNSFSDMGIGATLIHKNLKLKEISSLFILTILIGSVLAIVFYLFVNNFLVNFYQNNIYKNFSIFLSFHILINSIGVVPKALINRRKKFKALGIINVISNTISGIIAIILAYFEFSYYSLIFQGIIMSLITNILILRQIKMKLIFCFNIKYLKKSFSYSGYIFIFNFINYFAKNLDNILIGKYFGVETLGLYDKAYKLMLYPIDLLIGAINVVLHPIFARYQNDNDKIYLEYMRLLKILSILGIGVTCICFFSAKEIIMILYGVQWIGILKIFKILSISIILQIFTKTVGSLYMALGRTDKMFKNGFFYSGGLILAILIGIYMKEINILAINITLAFFSGFLFLYKGLLEIFKKNFKVFFLEFKETYILGLFLIILNVIMINFIKCNNFYIFFLIKVFINIFFVFIFIVNIYYKEKFLKHINHIFFIKNNRSY